MSDNSNNYIGTPLAWTKWTGIDDIPTDKQIAFKCADGKMMFGVNSPAQNGNMLIVDGYFYFDRMHQLKTSEWAVIDFVFETED